jgi:Ca-activated chloride channel family protein
MKQNAILRLSLLSLAIGLAACAVKRADVPADQDDYAQSAQREPAPMVAADERDALQAIVVTGTRISEADAEAGITQRVGRGLVANAPPPPKALADLVAEPAPNAERYAALPPNEVKSVALDPLSTFSIDVDTGSYTNVRRMLNQGQRPPADAVRAEEFINYFDYDYPLPTERSAPFSVTTELAAAPWNADRQLLLIGLKGYELPAQHLPKSNLVFLLDVSGSMNEATKLPLLKESLKLLVQQLDADDSVAIVVYAGAAGMVLPPTPGNERERIMAALDSLSAGGSTNGGEGINLAYALAREAYIEGGINRVILATDGDFNVGTTSTDQLKQLVEAQRSDGVSLTTLGFGQGNYNDELSEQLANIGNGNHAYIDTLAEARKVLVEARSATLFTIAKDVKIQIEFNPQQVSEYRLIGYQNRRLANADFNNDAKDAGEIGAGHEVTALYELNLGPAARAQPTTTQFGDSLALLKLRFKQADADQSQLLQFAVRAAEAQTDSERLRFAAAVAAFAELLRGTELATGFDYAAVSRLASGARGADTFGYRREFLDLVAKAARL